MPEMLQDSYRTIKKSSQGIFKDRGSKFLAFAWPVASEEEIKEILDTLRRDHHNARHHCFAWQLGADKILFRANDDGEPASTAGKPILGQIQKHDLTNILIVVVRYFGGTLLGTGGLINAYGKAAADALDNATIITRTIDEVFEIKFPYTSMNQVMKVIKEEQASLMEQDFGNGCRVMVCIPRKNSSSMKGRLQRIEKLIVNNKTGSYY